MTGQVDDVVAMNGASLLKNPSTPGFWSPIALSIPESVSAIRGTGRPLVGARVTLLVTIPPTRRRSISSDTSLPELKVPDAARTGVAKARPFRSTFSEIV